MKQCGAVIQIHDAFVGLAQHARRGLSHRVPRISWLVCVALLCHCSASVEGVHHDVISHGQFSHLRIYRPPGVTRQLALLLSGDAGWGADLDAIAQRLAARGSLVAGIDVREWLAVLADSPSSCLAPGAYLADLGRQLQQEYHLRAGAPILIGHSAGATLAYVALAQARPGEFAGALTLSFCADLDLPRPLCPAAPLRATPLAAGVRLQPGGALPARWIALHGIEDQICPVAPARAFAQAVPGARFLPIPGVGHSYADMQRWWGAFLGAYGELSVPPASAPP